MFWNHCGGGKTEVSLSILGMCFQILDDKCGFANRGPVNSIFIRYDHASIERWMRCQNFSESLDPFVIHVMQKRRANRRDYVFLFDCSGILIEKLNRFLLRHVADECLKWRSTDADCLNRVARLLERCFRGLERDDRVVKR